MISPRCLWLVVLAAAVLSACESGMECLNDHHSAHCRESWLSWRAADPRDGVGEPTATVESARAEAARAATGSLRQRHPRFAVLRSVLDPLLSEPLWQSCVDLPHVREGNPNVGERHTAALVA